MHIKLVSFLRLIVNSCIAELDLFKLICKTLIFLLCSRDSEIVDEGTAMDNCLKRMFVVDAGPPAPSQIETMLLFWSWVGEETSSDRFVL